MDKELTWRHLKGLHQLFVEGKTKNKIGDNGYIKHLIRLNIIRYKPGTTTLLKDDGFDAIYRKEFFANFIHYDEFLKKNAILNDQSRYPERDIRVLMFVHENKKEIVEQQYSRRRFSSAFFKDSGSKYLDERKGLENAILTLLGIDVFPGNDPKNQQYRFVVDCPLPRFIVLCENLDFLTQPWVSRECHAELWYAGGNNIAKLDHLPPVSLPIYYSCDWDFAGLSIYARIKEKIPEITLLYPEALKDAKSIHSGKHFSTWNALRDFSGLPRSIFTEKEIQLVESLIRNNQWIEEESNDFRGLLLANNLPVDQ